MIKESTAYLLTSAMEDVITSPNGTGGAARMSNMAVAGKTGTTNDSTDLWLSAYTPYYTASIWVGYDENKSMNNMNQSWHMRIWKQIMERIHSGLEYKDFTAPSSVVQKTICRETGKLAVSGCPAVTEYFDKDTVATESCPGHRSVEEENTDDTNTDDAENNTGSAIQEIAAIPVMMAIPAAVVLAIAAIPAMAAIPKEAILAVVVPAIAAILVMAELLNHQPEPFQNYLAILIKNTTRLLQKKKGHLPLLFLLYMFHCRLSKTSFAAPQIPASFPSSASTNFTFLSAKRLSPYTVPLYKESALLPPWILLHR